MNILQSAFGHYESKGSVDKADIVIGHSFGTSTDEESVNRLLAKCILNHADGRPIVVDHNLAEAFPDDATQPDLVVDGQVSTASGKGVGTWGTLIEAQKYMSEHHHSRPLMVAQAYHIGRVVMQAEKLEMDAVVPADLPKEFDTTSEQRWTRSLGLWVPREVIGSVALKIVHKL